jgi:hypothetical protein
MTTGSLLTRCIVAAASVAAALAPVAAARAQSVQVGVAGGIALPTGAYGRVRGPGPLVRGSLWLSDPQRRLRARGDVEGAWLLDRMVDPMRAGSSTEGSLRAVSALVSIVFGGTGPNAAPYLIAGAGPQMLRVTGARNPYGTTLGVRAGAGVRWHVGRAVLHAEVAEHFALTDFGTGRDFGMGSYAPVVVGASF